MVYREDWIEFHKQIAFIMILTGNIVDIHNRTVYYGQIGIGDGIISKIDHLGPERGGMPYLLPGFIDAHVHIESSMLPPGEFARIAVTHGTVATVSDPHEIANVLGIEGVRYMLDNADGLPFHICFGAPSCVPATAFETAGATIGPAGVKELLEMPGIGYLSEMMNYPGVLAGDPVVMEKLGIAHDRGVPVDGHAPGLTGNDAIRYIDEGISTDHECISLAEARFKIENGLKVIIREGSAARNFEALWPLILEHPGMLMFCSDDKHPDDLLKGHINGIVARAVKKGCNLYDVLRIACVNPVKHYHLPVGQLREGDPADLILVEDLVSFRVRSTYWKGEKVAENGQALFDVQRAAVLNRFDRAETGLQDFRVPAEPGSTHVRVIQAYDGELVTGSKDVPVNAKNGFLESDPANDLLFIAVVNRYSNDPPAVGMIHGFGLLKGAIASSVAHDSHHIVAVGISASELNNAVNLLIRSKGGVCAVAGPENRHLPLPIAGLMSDEQAEIVASRYESVDRYARQVLGSCLSAPLMALSFMALLVIPSLKMSDKGLFDGNSFSLVPLQFQMD